MERIQLENELMLIEINHIGAELSRVYSKQYQREILWNGDARYWGRRSPVLFPIVGKLVNNETIIEEKTYTMGQHGFARDMEFQLVNKTENSVKYLLKSDKSTKERYPYDFEFVITYTLIDENVTIAWEITNIDDRSMHFSVGAHPAFNVPYNGADSLLDYYLEFEAPEKIEEYILHPPFIDGKNIINKPEKLFLSPDLFRNDALVYGLVDKITIASNTSDMKININFKGFPYVGVWSPYYEQKNAIAPFVCIEPWFGIADPTDSNRMFKLKPGINKLEPKKIFEVSYTISLI